MVCDMVILLNDLFIYNHLYPYASNELVECFRLSLKVLQAGSNLLMVLQNRLVLGEYM
jgi:hypothetical protein